MEYMKQRDLSLVDIAAETAKRRRYDEEEETTQSRRFLFLIGGVILLVAGLAVGGYLFFSGNKAGAPTANLQPPKSLVLSEKQKIITLTSERRSELISSAQNALGAPIAITTVLDIPILEKTPEATNFLGASDLFRILQINPPANLIQSLDGSFTLGVFYLKKNSPFLVFGIQNYDLALSGMLSWEKNIANDLGDILLIKNQPKGIPEFHDIIIKNYDSRILYDSSNNPVLIYTFIGKIYLIITVDADTVQELIRRLIISP